jgi:hypothetical protein
MAVGTASHVYALDVAVDDTSIYLMDYGAVVNGYIGGGVYVIDKATDASRYVGAPFASECTAPLIIHVSAMDGTLYWVEHDAVSFRMGGDCGNAHGFERIMALGAGASTPREVVRVADGGNPLLAAAGRIFWTDQSATWRMDPRGGAPEQLAAIGGDALATDGSTLFTFHMTTLTAITAPGQVATVYGGPQQVQGIAVDGAHVYFGSFGGLMRMSHDGSDLATLAAQDSNTPVVDAAQVYYFSGSSLMTACK